MADNYSPNNFSTSSFSIGIYFITMLHIISSETAGTQIILIINKNHGTAGEEAPNFVYSI